MEIGKDDDGDDTLRLYHASVEGSVSSLNTLIQNNPLVLRRVSLTTLSETPLHLSALLGYLEFSKIILAHNPRLAKELDSSRRSPLHLASAEGHKELVQVLLPAFPDACLFRDQEGRIPLHYAAMRGRVEVVKELIRANPQSVETLVDRSGETSLHLCVKHNHLDCLEVLVKEVGENSDLLNSGTGSNDSMTILQLAMIQRQIKTITYLASLPAIRKNLVNNVVLGTLEYGPRDFRSLEIEQILMNACTNKNEIGEYQQQEFSTTLPKSPLESTIVGKKIIKSGLLPLLWMKIMLFLNYNKSGRWFEETRGMLMVVATMISTMTFQAAINPPGGVWQDNISSSSIGGQEYCSKENLCFAGTAVLGYVWEDDMKTFMMYNTVSFISSLTVTLFLVSGFPLTNKICIWFLSMALCITITFTGLSYVIGVYLVMPYNVADHLDSTYSLLGVQVWFTSLVIVGGFHTCRFLAWLGKKVHSKFRKKKVGKWYAHRGWMVD